ncbi:MAG: glycosyltransferase [Candidatus Auribacterota bacterium]|jgi:glycosyltransferase involved in cell wall biosynthesis|nr:glycosyltransferase [Candidatus Auribacterota bacterium]
MKITYILQAFPQISETFIINEILALRDNKPDIHLSIISLKRPKRPAPHESVRSLQVDYLSEINISLVKLAVFILIKSLLRPIAVAKSMWYFARVKRGNFLFYYTIRYWRLLFMLFRLAYIIEKQNSHHLHAHFGNNPAQFAMCAYLITGIPYSFTTHARDIFVYNELLYWKHHYAEFSVTISDYNKKYLEQKLHVESERLHVVPCCINASYFTMKKYERDTDKPFFITAIGRLVEKKGFQFLINVCKRMKTDNLNFKCYIIGNGPLKESYQRLIDTLSVNDEVILCGEKTQEYIRSILHDTDVFVLPCIKAADGDMDGVPVVLKEAMAMGVVCISTMFSGIPELLEGSGILVPPEDEYALYSAVKDVYFMTPEQKNKIALAQRKVIEDKFTLKRQADMLYSLFRKSIDRQRG